MRQVVSPPKVGGSDGIRSGRPNNETCFLEGFPHRSQREALEFRIGYLSLSVFPQSLHNG